MFRTCWLALLWCSLVACGTAPARQPAKLFVPPEPDGTWQLVGLGSVRTDHSQGETVYERGREVTLKVCATTLGHVTTVTHLHGGEASAQISARAFARRLKFDPEPSAFCKNVVLTMAWHAKNEDPPVIVRKTPLMLAPNVGMKRCLSCELPAPPKKARNPRDFSIFKVCVNELGDVWEPPMIVYQGESTERLETLQTSIRKWKFEPLALWGVPMPFCFVVRAAG